MNTTTTFKAYTAEVLEFPKNVTTFRPTAYWIARKKERDEEMAAKKRKAENEKVINSYKLRKPKK